MLDARISKGCPDLEILSNKKDLFKNHLKDKRGQLWSPVFPTSKQLVWWQGVSSWSLTNHSERTERGCHWVFIYKINKKEHYWHLFSPIWLGVWKNIARDVLKRTQHSNTQKKFFFLNQQYWKPHRIVCVEKNVACVCVKHNCVLHCNCVTL